MEFAVIGQCDHCPVNSSIKDSLLSLSELYCDETKAPSCFSRLDPTGSHPSCTELFVTVSALQHIHTLQGMLQNVQ